MTHRSVRAPDGLRLDLLAAKQRCPFTLKRGPSVTDIAHPAERAGIIMWWSRRERVWGIENASNHFPHPVRQREARQSTEEAVTLGRMPHRVVSNFSIPYSFPLDAIRQMNFFSIFSTIL